jgi:hypothetical protein
MVNQAQIETMNTPPPDQTKAESETAAQPRQNRQPDKAFSQLRIC